MTKLRMLALLVVAAHWIDAIWHLFLAAKILPAPNNHVNSLAIVLITAGHAVVSIALWTLGDKLAGSVSLIFFLAAMGADLYEHFLHASGNNVFMLAPGYWSAIFDASVFLLIALQILGCLLGIPLLGGKTRNSKTAPGLKSNPGRQDRKLSAGFVSRQNLTCVPSLVFGRVFPQRKAAFSASLLFWGRDRSCR